jgi:proline iminopeptidase
MAAHHRSSQKVRQSASAKVDIARRARYCFRMRVEEGTTSSGLYWKALGEGPTVVVLHGGPAADHGYLLPQFATLADEMRLLFYDQRGGGRSRAGTPTPTAGDHVADLRGVCEELAEGPVRLCGYSWGGLLALLYALEHGDVERLALVAPAPPVATYRAEMDQVMRARTARAAELGLSGFALAVAGYFVDPARARELTPFRVQKRAADSTWQSLGEYDLRMQLGSLDTPTLILHGDGDPIPIRYSEETARLLPHARLVSLERCGHVPYIEARAPFFAALRGFLLAPRP